MTAHGTWEIGAGELDRLLTGERIQRPNRSELTAGEWDWYRALSATDRRWFGRQCMADIGVRPEDVQRTHGYETVDAAMAAVLEAARIDQRRRARKTAATAGQLTRDEADDYERELQRRDRTDYYGPHELAAILSTSVQNVHQMKSRGKLPAADMIVSRVPMWHGSTLQAAGILEEG